MGCFWASGGLFVFGVGVCLSFCFCLSMSLFLVWVFVCVLLFGTLKTVCTQRVNLITYLHGGEMLIFLCAVVSKTLIFLTFSRFVEILVPYQLSYIINTIPAYSRALVCEIYPYFSQVYM